ncbi:hypothetical protein EON63_03245 [archaeon]|nr:MAG: hypothetical protein EON63_03245 [archaeon]
MAWTWYEYGDGVWVMEYGYGVWVCMCHQYCLCVQFYCMVIFNYKFMPLPYPYHTNLVWPLQVPRP